MSDTSVMSANVQAMVHRRLSGFERLRIAIDMSAAVRTLARSGIARDHPEWSDRQIDDELVRRSIAACRIARR